MLLGESPTDVWRSASLTRPEWHAAFIDAEQAKQRYQEAFDAAHAANLPEPPRFDEAFRRSGDATSQPLD